MRENPFVILGINRDATQHDIYVAYKNLRKKYADDRFLEGEAGADAAKKLEQLDAAYSEALEYCHTSATVDDGSSIVAEVKKAIKNKDLSLAQEKLDSMSRRDSEWHYLQSIIFYERSWYSDCKKQLEVSIELDPTNSKYKKALSNLNEKMNSANGNQSQFEQNRSYQGQNQFNNRSYNQHNGYRNDSNMACGLCQTLLCADCCCECMGGDLISCC